MSDVKTDNVSINNETEAIKRKIVKEETMFRVDNDGKLIPEKISVEVYDRALDKELIEESEMLAHMITKQKAVLKICQGSINNLDAEIIKAKKDLETEEKKKVKDTVKIVELKRVVELRAKDKDLIKRKNESLTEELNLKLDESRKLIKALEEEKKNQTKIMEIEGIPLTSAEAYYVFEKKLTPEGKETEDVVASVIELCLTSPKYSFDEATKMKLDYKLAYHDAIMELSNYLKTSYRQVLLERLRSDKKKDMPRT